MDKLSDPIRVDFQITDVANKCNRHIKKITELVTFINNSILNFDETFNPPLEVDALSIGFNDPGEIPSTISRKDESLTWVFQKAFEELIVGVTESLIEAHKVVSLMALSQETRERKIHRDDVLKAIQEINERPLKLYLPILIKEIEDILNSSLSLKNQILSINQVRNCMVHRNSKVSFKDVNTPDSKALKLSYQELVVLSEKDGKIIEVKKEHKNPGFSTNKLGVQTRNKDVFFQIGESVKIDPTTFNNISLTCILFVTKLLDIIPLPTEGPAPNNT